MNRYNTLKHIALALTLTISNIGFSQEWTVPEDAKSVVSSVPFSEMTQQQGKDLFNANCKSCHGAIGTNAPLPLNPSPGDPASERFAAQVDGALFFKITNGRAGMPSFKNTLSDADRWALISYIRTFHPNYKGAVAENPSAVNTFKGGNIQMKVSFDDEKHIATVNLSGTENGSVVPASGVRVGAFVQRYFGQMKLGEPIKTNASGVATFEFPTDLQGDSIGQLKIIFKLIDEDKYGLVVAEQTVNWGEKFVYQNPLDQNALWGDRTAVPTWLLLSYFGVVLSVFAVIGWVVLQLLKLKNLK